METNTISQDGVPLPPDTNPTSNKPSEFDQFLENYRIAYLNLLRGEINIRIQAYNKYLLSKMATIGALFAFVFTWEPSINKEPHYMLICLTVPVIAISYDLLLAKNIRAIRNIAHYLKEHVETVYAKSLKGWETYIEENPKKYLNYDGFDVVLNCLSSVLISIMYYIFLADKIYKPGIDCWIDWAFAVVVLGILALTGSSIVVYHYIKKDFKGNPCD